VDKIVKNVIVRASDGTYRERGLSQLSGGILIYMYMCTYEYLNMYIYAYSYLYVYRDIDIYKDIHLHY
jgi:hypothetical protein